MKKLLLVTGLLVWAFLASAQETETYTGPIIDMHMHGYQSGDYWGGETHPTGIESPGSAEEHMKITRRVMSDYNVVLGVMDSNALEVIRKRLAPDKRFLAGVTDWESLPDPETFEEMVKRGEIQAFGEIAAVYHGRTLADPMYAPYLEICEKYGVPVGYHTGGGPPNTTYGCCPDFRLSLGDPLLIEDVLAEYPDLKLYLMHAGEMYYEHAVRMVRQYPQLHLELGVLLWVDPIVKDYAVRLLRLAKDVRILDRVMFGSDQMAWPGAIGASVEFLNAMDFLTKEEKSNIFYGNAARFLGLSEEEMASHHGK